MINEKKVLLLGTGLHHKDATGITLSNLFSSWTKENILMAVPMDVSPLSKDAGYLNIYELGLKEYKHKFPLNFVKRIYLSTKKIKSSSKKGKILNNQVESNKKSSLKQTKSVSLKIISTLFSWIVNHTGLKHYLIRCELSPNLIEWIEKHTPDYFYTLLSNRHSILFALAVCKKFQKPVIVHIMDDWPSTIVKPGLFAKFWRRKIDLEFRALLKIAYKRIAISKSMKLEYENRYSNSWEYFHNPVIIEDWIKFQVRSLPLTPKKILRIGYFGRVGRANETSIIKFLNVLKNSKLKVNFEFHLFSTFHQENSENLFFHDFIDYKDVPEAISKFDFLLLPLSFSEDDINFARFSIPTKMSEYLITGIPVILFAPENTAVSSFFNEYKCGFRINKFDSNSIIECLNEIQENWIMTSIYSDNAKKIAFDLFESSKVLEKFQTVFIDS